MIIERIPSSSLFFFFFFRHFVYRSLFTVFRCKRGPIGSLLDVLLYPRFIEKLSPETRQGRFSRTSSPPLLIGCIDGPFSGNFGGGWHCDPMIQSLVIGWDRNLPVALPTAQFVV